MIKLKSVSKSFGKHKVIKNVDMEITPGEPIAIIGPNGSGKTTLFSLISGFIKPDSGMILFKGKVIPHEQQFGELAVLPQDAQLDPRFSIYKQFRFFSTLQGLTGKVGREEINRVLDLVNLSEYKHKKITVCSHGMKKRASIAQALIGAPSIVLLDEPTAGLDPIHAREIRELVSGLSEHITFVLSSHDLSELERLCSRVYFFEEGKLLKYSGEGTLNQVSYLTVRLQKDYENANNVFSNIDGVIDVRKMQSKEFLLSYHQHDKQFDLNLLKTLHNNGLNYQQIYNGKTLENQLFDA